MFSFGLFSSLLPFLVMLLVSAFGMLTHINSQRNTGKNLAAATEEVEHEENTPNATYYNPFEANSEIVGYPTARAFEDSFIGMEERPEFNSGLRVFASENPAGQNIFSRPPPCTSLFV